MSIESVILSNHLILCHPLFLLPSIFPSIRVFSNESALRIRGQKYWSFSFSISPSNEYSGLISIWSPWYIYDTYIYHHEFVLYPYIVLHKYMYIPYGRKWRRTKEPLDESERGEWKSWLKAQHLENKDHGIWSHHFLAISWGNNGKQWETLFFWAPKITADGECSHEIKRHLLLGRKAMTNLDSTLKSRDIICQQRSM